MMPAHQGVVAATDLWWDRPGAPQEVLCLDHQVVVVVVSSEKAQEGHLEGLAEHQARLAVVAAPPAVLHWDRPVAKLGMHHKVAAAAEVHHQLVVAATLQECLAQQVRPVVSTVLFLAHRFPVAGDTPWDTRSSLANFPADQVVVDNLGEMGSLLVSPLLSVADNLWEMGNSPAALVAWCPRACPPPSEHLLAQQWPEELFQLLHSCRLRVEQPLKPFSQEMKAPLVMHLGL